MAVHPLKPRPFYQTTTVILTVIDYFPLSFCETTSLALMASTHFYSPNFKHQGWHWLKLHADLIATCNMEVLTKTRVVDTGVFFAM